MLTRIYLLALLLLSMLVLAFWPEGVSAENPTATTAAITSTATTTATPTQTPRFFNVRLNTKPLDSPAGPLQDVQGRVLTKTGGGLDGVSVRAFSNDWQAFETTKDGGKFKFSLSRGSYTIQLVDVVAQEAKLTADGKTELGVEFYEVDSAPALPTLPPATATSTATATASPTSSPTESPTSTPVPLPTTIAQIPTVQPTASAGASALAFPVDLNIDLGAWLHMFLYGAAAGGAFVILGLAVAMVRRL